MNRCSNNLIRSRSIRIHKIDLLKDQIIRSIVLRVIDLDLIDLITSIIRSIQHIDLIDVLRRRNEE